MKYPPASVIQPSTFPLREALDTRIWFPLPSTMKIPMLVFSKNLRPLRSDPTSATFVTFSGPLKSCLTAPLLVTP